MLSVIRHTGRLQLRSHGSAAENEPDNRQLQAVKSWIPSIFAQYRVSANTISRKEVVWIFAMFEI